MLRHVQGKEDRQRNVNSFPFLQLNEGTPVTKHPSIDIKMSLHHETSPSFTAVGLLSKHV